MNTCLDVDVPVQGCTHGRFEVLFGIGGVALVGNPGTSAHSFERSSHGNEHVDVPVTVSLIGMTILC